MHLTNFIMLYQVVADLRRPLLVRELYSNNKKLFEFKLNLM